MSAKCDDFLSLEKSEKKGEEKKIERIASLFFWSVPLLTTNSFLRATLRKQNTNETRTKRERNKNKNDERVFIFYARVCVQKQCCTTLFTNEEFFFAGFLVSRECRSLVKFDIIRISPRGERARFAPNSKRNLRNVLDPVKRFFPRQWRP